MINTAIERTKTRKHFFRNLYRKELNLLMFFFILQFIIILVTMYVFVSKNRQLPSFYASSSTGVLTLLKPMPMPNNTNKPLLE